jgi:hypothetical protein
MFIGEEVRCVNLNSDLVHFLILYLIAWTILGVFTVLSEKDTSPVIAFTRPIRRDSITFGVIMLVFVGIKLGCIVEGR